VFALPEKELENFVYKDAAELYAVVEKLGGKPVVEDALPAGKSHAELSAAIEITASKSARHETNAGWDLRSLCSRSRHGWRLILEFLIIAAGCDVGAPSRLFGVQSGTLRLPCA
jgi:hypothetical protein